VDRLACVDLPALPLQLLLMEHPEWHGHPAAVVAEDRPQALLLWINDQARRSGIHPGQRYAAALALDSHLRAGVVPENSIERCVASLSDRLRLHTPGVEPSAAEPGVFWLDARGLEPLYLSLSSWARSIGLSLREAGFRSTIIVGFTRFGTYAVARSGAASLVFRTREEEEAAAARVPLLRLGMEPAVREALGDLGVRTVREFLRLPAGGILERFGPEAERFHRLASGDLFAPLAPLAAPEPLEIEAIFDSPIADTGRLLFHVKRLLDPLLLRLAARREALAGLTLTLKLDRGASRVERLRPAAATLQAAQLLALIRLRLETLQLDAGVVEAILRAVGEPATADQLRLFPLHGRREPVAANRALARLRALFGDGAVVQARLGDAHLPEACFGWKPIEKVTLPSPRRVAVRPLVRRLHDRPIELPTRSRHEPDGWLVRGREHGRVVRLLGPFVLSGGWWGGGVRRDYHYAETDRGEILWIFYDRRRRRWFLHGRVE